jgi:hypothetical protein
MKRSLLALFETVFFLGLLFTAVGCSRQATDFVKGKLPSARQPATTLSDDTRGVRFSGGQSLSSGTNTSISVNVGQGILRTTGNNNTLSATISISRESTSQ